MNFINPPQNIIHKTFYSKLYNHEVGYNIYLPSDYEDGNDKYPVAYHLHGWMGDESSEIWTMEKVYKNRQAITVFPNNSPVIEAFENLPVESMIITELIPHIDAHYRTVTTREGRSISGFSMGEIFRDVFLGNCLCGHIPSLLSQRLSYCWSSTGKSS